MTLLQIQYILAIARMRSLNRAAEQLFVSQPALTGALRDLEAELHITLFQRTNRGVFPTKEGEEFLVYARQIWQQVELLQKRYLAGQEEKRYFAVSSQHYAFVVKAFAETVRRFDTLHFEFAMRETRTTQVIRDVGERRSELGVLFLSRHNRRVVTRMLTERRLDFHPLLECHAAVYLAKEHPLAGERTLSLEQLEPYPWLGFEQGEDSSSFFAEEIFSDRSRARMIRVTDRGTMLNLMKALNGYTLCSGIICTELTGEDYRVVPCREEEDSGTMEIGVIQRRDYVPDRIGQAFLEELNRCLQTGRKKEE